MTYDEFNRKCEQLTGGKNVSVSDDDFKVIEFVYTYHPQLAKYEEKNKSHYFIRRSE